jgi:general secretion pathway protein I
MRRVDHRARGFTLLEVLVALAVLALALTALVRMAAIATRDFDGLRERTLASWIASNVLSDVRLKEHYPPIGRRDGRVRYAGREWSWELTVQATPESGIRRLDVQVFADVERTDAVAFLTGFAGENVQP